MAARKKVIAEIIRALAIEDWPSGAVLREVRAIDQISDQIPRRTKPRAKTGSPRKKSRGSRKAGDALLQHHCRERIDVGLQHHEQSDQAGQRDRMLEHKAKDGAFV